MSNAGYGNHDAPPPKAADAKTPKTDEASKTEARTSGASDTAPPAPERRDASTPGQGALPDGPQGDEVDPGVG